MYCEVEFQRGFRLLDRDSALQAVRSKYEIPIWKLLCELEKSLGEFALVTHVNVSDSRAVGSMLNCALKSAVAECVSVEDDLSVQYFKKGHSYKLSGAVEVDQRVVGVSFELHLCDPLGGTSKPSHQFAEFDVEAQPTFPGFEVDAPEDLLLFIACNLSVTGSRFTKAYFKYADGIDRRQIEIHRTHESVITPIAEEIPVREAVRSTITLKKKAGAKENDGSEADQR